jgi:hypothetical protein
MLQEAAAAGNNKHNEESFVNPNGAVDATAKSSAAASAAANTETAATPRRVREWSVADVQAFFCALELGEYNAAIKKEKVDGRMLQDLLAEDGLGELGIKSKVHLLRIKHGLEDAAQDHAKDTCGGNAAVRCCALPPVASHTAMLSAALSCSSSRSARPSTSVRTTTRRARSRTRTTRCSRR